MPRITKAKLGIILALLAGLGITLALSVRSTKAEPRYHGMPLRTWMRASTNGVDQIDIALGEIGPSAIPCLVRALSENDSLLRKGWVWLWPKLPVATRQRSEDPEYTSAYIVRRKAMAALERWGPEARAAIPELTRIVLSRTTDPQSRLDALPALAEVGVDSPEAVLVLVQALTNRAFTHNAAFALARLGTHAKPALPALLELVKGSRQKAPTPGLPAFEMMALAAIGPEAAPAQPALINALTNAALCSDALQALKAIGPGAGSVPALLEVLRHGTPDQRYGAVECLRGIGPAAELALPELELIRRDDNPVLRVLAAAALGAVRGKPESAVPELLKEMQQGRYDPSRHPYWGYHVPYRVFLPPTEHKNGVSVGHVGAAAWYLGELGPSAQEAVPVLEGQMRANNDWQSLIAAEALWKITGRAELVLPHLLQALQSQHSSQKILAIRLLGEMGPAATGALPALRKLQGASVTLRREVSEAVCKIVPSQAENSKKPTKAATKVGEHVT